jgi:hypothetical protein
MQWFSQSFTFFTLDVDKANMFRRRALVRDVNAINLQNLPARAGFAGGESVHVSARMGSTFNKPGSAATVL